MSGASEATLQDLLAVNKDMAAAIKGLAAKTPAGASQGGAGGGGGGYDPKGPGIFSKALNGAGSMLTGTFSAAAGLASTAFTQIANTGKAVWAGQQQLAQTAIDGSGKLSSFADAMSGLPGILGMIAKAAAYGAKQQEANLKLFQDVSQSGALFGGSLTQTKATAVSLGMSFQEFGQMMKDNVGTFHKLGGTAQDGADRLVKFNKGFLNGETGRMVMNLGYNTQEAANLMGNYAETMGGISQAQMNDQKGMEASVKAFAEELTLSAALEGISRQEKEKQMKEQAANAARELLLSKMTAEEKQRYIEAENRAGLIGGKAAKDALLSATLGLPPMTKEAQVFTAMQSKASKEVLKLGEIAKDGSLSEAERQKRMDATTASGQKAMADTTAKLGKTGVALAFQQGAVADQAKASLKAQADANNKGLKSEEDYQKNIEKTRQQIQEAEKKGDAGATQQAANRAKYQGQLMDRLNAALARLFPIVVKVVEAFVQLFTFGVTFAEKVLIPAFKDLFGNISVKDITQPFVDFFDGLFGTSGGDLDFNSIKEGIVNFIAPIRDFVGDIVKSINFKEVGKTIRETFIGIKNFVMGMWESFSIAMGGGDGMMETFKSIWTSVKSTVMGIIDGISYVVKLFLASPLFETLKKMFGLVVKIIVDLVDVVVAIVKSPLGTFLINALMDVFGFFGDVINSILEAVDGIIEIVSGVFKILTGDFKGGWEKIKGGVVQILKSVIDFFISIPKLIFNIFKDGIVGIIDSLKGIITSVIDGIKAVASGIVSFFSSKKDDAKANAEPPKQNPAVTAAASSASQATKTADQYAKDVYDKKMDMAKVPADMQAKVSEILKNPPAAWKAAVNQTQQTNNQQQKTEEPKKTDTAKKEEPKKDKEPPPTDLNNKDALGILKTIADYQYKTISAVKDLNGNLLKR